MLFHMCSLHDELLKCMMTFALDLTSVRGHSLILFVELILGSKRSELEKADMANTMLLTAVYKGIGHPPSIKLKGRQDMFVYLTASCMNAIWFMCMSMLF